MGAGIKFDQIEELLDLGSGDKAAISSGTIERALEVLEQVGAARVFGVLEGRLPGIPDTILDGELFGIDLRAIAPIGAKLYPKAAPAITLYLAIVEATERIRNARKADPARRPAAGGLVSDEGL